VLGSGEYVRQVLPRMVADVQFYHHTSAEYDSAVRWADRLTLEDNLLKTWQAIVEFYFRHSERPFAVDAATLRRDDDPPDYICFREAAINLLIHQDFGDTTRVPIIRFFRDQNEFSNPGDAFASRDQLLDPGDKEVRNPAIVNAFRRIGLSDQAGTGVRAIFDGWRKLGYLPPEIDNDKAEKRFRLRLRKEKLITETQLLAQASLGIPLSTQEANVFAYLTRKNQIDLTDVKALTGLSAADALQLMQRLTAQALVVVQDDTGSLFRLAAHLHPRPSSRDHENQSITANFLIEEGTVQASEQATSQAGSEQAQLVQPMMQLSPIQRQVVAFAHTPRTIAELTAHTGHKQRAFFKRKHLEPLLAGGILQMTVPDKPTSPIQRYVLTEIGLRLKHWYKRQAQSANPAHVLKDD